MSTVRTDCRDGIGTLTIERPDAGNALDLPTVVAFRAAVTELGADDRVRVIVLASTGRLFCAGGDVRAMARSDDPEAFVAELAGTLHEGLEALRALPVPIVAAVQGPTAGAGIGLVLAADIVIAAENASFVAAYSAIGLSPDGGLTALLPSVVGTRRAALFALTNRALDAATALEWGLVSEVCAPDALDARAREVAASLAAVPGRAAGETARELRLATQRDYASQLSDEAATIARLAATPDAMTLIKAFGAGSP